jgi:hypothetical protein
MGNRCSSCLEPFRIDSSRLLRSNAGLCVANQMGFLSATSLLHMPERHVDCSATRAVIAVVIRIRVIESYHAALCRFPTYAMFRVAEDIVLPDSHIEMFEPTGIYSRPQLVLL